ncbi:hypothetical protein Syun_006782 [Stephania yunnanensis]|uniref:Uncharacterized protein n=1 Tax=Stephania yunnanensis TaxID=152371 RepID=A0AAP0KXI7_9MAGN
MSSAPIDTQACLGTKMRGKPPLRIHGIIDVRRPRKALERAVPSPSPTARGARSPRGAARAARQAADGFGLGPRAHPLVANPFPGYDPFCRLPLPTFFHRPRSFTLETRCGYEYDRRERYSVLRIFKGRRGAPTPPTCGALPAAGPYLRRAVSRGAGVVKRKKITLPEAPADVSDSLTLPSTAASRSEF